MDDSTYSNLDFALRFAARVGFCILLLTLYRLYTLFASPLMQQRHRKYFILFGISVIISFILLAINYIIPAAWMSTTAATFNVLITYVFSFFLYFLGNRLAEYRDTEEYKRLSRSMDAMILKLKAR